VGGAGSWERLFVDTVRFVGPGPEDLEHATHGKVVFEDPGGFGAAKAELGADLEPFVKHYGFEAAATVLTFDAESDDAGEGGIFPSQEIRECAGESSAEEAATEGLEGDVVIRDGEEEAGGVVVIFGDPDEAFTEEWFEAAGQEVDLGIGHGGEPPVIRPGGIIDRFDLLEVLVELAPADGAEREARVALAHPLGDAAEAVHGGVGEVDVEGEEIAGLLEAGFLEVVDVVRWVVGHHEDRW
jgi:hypothetical protein